MLTGDSITGSEAQQIGLVLKSVPKEHLEYEVEQLADRLCKIDPDLLSANKRIINMGLELMGARTLQRMAVENDVRGHNALPLSASESPFARLVCGRRCAIATPSSAMVGRASMARSFAMRRAGCATIDVVSRGAGRTAESMAAEMARIA